ncbi:hypothetical protein SAMN04488093_10259 [Tropicibacter naphthalenivorans]|uniref:Uncharacterized protein n=2 Tax=Tropicibacter naphthalenivorans TaxID=441103 RepID=A0A0P1GU48_9RHOB|nr:hypothetical protein TRN7648_01558 [Tropicibacter naphthalenivorans]SMC55995.1 hypothetical protein SAMN04488093_10259 [Tropicibacter naphthalenivorans]
MLGVVLWADHADHRAVIWCEDQGELAYYAAAQSAAQGNVGLDVGDLIEFDMRRVRNCRLAAKVQRLGRGYARDLPKALRANAANPAATATQGQKRPAAKKSKTVDNIVPFVRPSGG